MKLKLGLDIGVASVGWGIIDENYEIIDSGVRLFSERSADDNVVRRTSRSTRRRIRRLQHRLERMRNFLLEIFGIKKLNSEEYNIYEVRCRGLEQKLSKDEIIRAILHLTKRRGTHFLTAEDFIELNNEKSTESILQEQEEKLANAYVCQIQLENFNRNKVRGIENRFRNKEYLKELTKLLETQGQYYKEILNNKDEIIKIYSSKREYFEGPGSEKSPTPYGRWRYDEQGNLIEVNLIELMRGACTFFPEEKRIAKNSYTACLFNLLNDLNNLTVEGREISFDEKNILISQYVNKGKNVSLNNIASVCNCNKEDIRGYRVNKDDKAIFTEFSGYIEILKAVKKSGEDNCDIVGNRKLVDEIAEILTKEKNVEERFDKLILLKLKDTVAEELSKLNKFTQYHSLSKKAMELILDDLLESNLNQMQLFFQNGLAEKKNQDLKGSTIKFDGSDWIVSPVTKRAVSETVKVINAVRKKVRKEFNADFSEIVIEMAREKNTKDKLVFIKKVQKEQEKINKEIKDHTGENKVSSKIAQTIKLWLEQDCKCAYSQQAISINDIMDGNVEIDHIIPLSLSFDDSQSNKVAVYIYENQKKGQRTPLQYLKSGSGKISYDQYKAWVIKTYAKNKKKRENLLYEGDPRIDLTGFINRNLNDTRYASKEVLNLLQSYFKANNLNTKISVIKGSFTHYFRKKAKLNKNRELTYAHHAQDALIVAGLSNIDLMKKVQNIATVIEDKENIIVKDNKIVNIATGEIISKEDFSAGKYIQFIKGVELIKPKYSFKVDKKPNRQLYDANIKATRTIDDKTSVITKYKNIYDVSGEKLKEKILQKPEDLLMYHYDEKTFKIFQEIVKQYADSKNPFNQYFLETGMKVRKYAKDGNGPEINDVKFCDGELGNHRKNIKQVSENKSVYLQIKTLRADFYLDEGIYKFVTVPYDMIKPVGTEFEIEKDKYEAAKNLKKISKKAEYLFSLHRGERFSYIDKGEYFEYNYTCVNNDKTNRLDVKYFDKPNDKQIKKTIGKNISELKKYNIDVLGNKYEVQREELRFNVSL